MTRLVSIAGILVTASVTIAAEPAGFAFTGVETTPWGQVIPISPNGDAHTVYLITTSSGNAGGMMANAQTATSFKITNPIVEDFGGYYQHGVNCSSSVADASLGYYVTLWAYGVKDCYIPAGAAMAKFDISVPVGTPVGTRATLSTQTQYYRSSWDTGRPTGQATVDLVVIPEPAVALLLLAGLPLIRRRVVPA